MNRWAACRWPWAQPISAAWQMQWGTIICRRVSDETRIRFLSVIGEIKERPGMALIEILVSLGARDDLGRPTTTPKQNKRALMDELGMVKQQ